MKLENQRIAEIRNRLNNLNERQKQCLQSLPKEHQAAILSGIPIEVIDLKEGTKKGGLEVGESYSFNMENIYIPDHAIESIARILLPEIQKYYQDEENQKQLEKWRAEQKKTEQIK